MSRFAEYLELRAAEAVIDRQREQITRLVVALGLIAAADYRGNRSPESEIARRALAAEEQANPRTPKGTA